MKNYKVSHTLIILLSIIGLIVAFVLFNDTYTTSQSKNTAMFGMIVFVLSIVTAITNLNKKNTSLPINKSNKILFYCNGFLLIIYTIATLLFLFKGGNIKMLKLILIPLILSICFTLTYLFHFKKRKASFKI